MRPLLVLGIAVGVTPLSPVGGAAADQTPTPSASASPSAGPSSAGSPVTVSPSAAVTGAPSATPTPSPVNDPTLTTTLTRTPGNPSVDRSPDFTFRSSRPGASFRCRLTGPGHPSQAFRACTSGDDVAGTGSNAYSTMTPSTGLYTFTVKALVPLTTGTTVVPETDGPSTSYHWRVYSVTSPDHYSPPSGARFNTPTGTSAQRRTNLTHAIRTVNSMPGYLQGTQGAPCPRSSDLVPSTIRVSLYSMTDPVFAKAMIAANRRCVSTQILMNNHLDSSTDPAWRILTNALGSSVYLPSGGDARSFAHLCNDGCRGHGVLHTKMYLFDSQVPAPGGAANRINDTVMTGSSNMTQNAAGVQWNDLYTIRSNVQVHRDFAQMFDRMKTGHRSSTLYRYDEGRYTSTFWPQGSTTDPYSTMLSSIHCGGATGGSGIVGHTVVYINMHAWFGTRGEGFARKVRSLYHQGCYVRVLYSFMSYTVYQTLHAGTGSRMSVRRTSFTRNGVNAYLYSHFKNIDVSGNVGGDSSSWVVWTGSNNFTDGGTHNDEVTMRIASYSAYVAYVRHFKSIAARRSSLVYANYSEPVGGGRAPG